jgi:hypothetical protein
MRTHGRPVAVKRCIESSLSTMVVASEGATEAVSAVVVVVYSRPIVEMG